MNTLLLIVLFMLYPPLGRARPALFGFLGDDEEGDGLQSDGEDGRLNGRLAEGERADELRQALPKVARHGEEAVLRLDEEEREEDRTGWLAVRSSSRPAGALQWLLSRRGR